MLIFVFKSRPDEWQFSVPPISSPPSSSQVPSSTPTSPTTAPSSFPYDRFETREYLQSSLRIYNKIRYDGVFSEDDYVAFRSTLRDYG